MKKRRQACLTAGIDVTKAGLYRTGTPTWQELKARGPVRLFALIFALALATVQVIFIDAYFRWLGAGWPLPPVGAVFLVGVPVIVELYGDDILTRYRATAPLLAQARSGLWQVINALLVVAGAWAGYGWEWWHAALLLLAVLAAPAIAAEELRRAGGGGRRRGDRNRQSHVA